MGRPGRISVQRFCRKEEKGEWLVDIQADFDRDMDEERSQMRRERISKMKLLKEKQMRTRRYLKMAAPAAAGVLALVFAFMIVSPKKDTQNKTVPENTAADNTMPDNTVLENTVPAAQAPDLKEDVRKEARISPAQAREPDASPSETRISAALSDSISQIKVPLAKETGSTRQVGEEILSTHAVLVDLDSNSIAAQKNAMDRMNPASMTKILTVLVAAEQLKDPRQRQDDTFTITLDITDYSYVNKCSIAGFDRDETVTVRDLFYGTILPSGADAAVGLATYVAGSQEDFVKLMNQKLEDLGLSDTAHVTNCVGLYDEDHYCSVYDMAVILRAALANDYCREVLSAHTYTTSKTEQHPEGITISNWFLRRIEDKDTGGEVVCGKTGYVVQSDHCAASYYESEDGKRYICVTAGASSPWRCIYDQVELYRNFR